MISDHRRVQIMGDKQEKRVAAKQLGKEGQNLLNIKQNRLQEEKKREQAEIRRCEERQSAMAAM